MKLILSLFAVILSVSFGFSQQTTIDINKQGKTINTELTKSEIMQIPSLSQSLRVREIEFNDQLILLTPNEIGSTLSISLFEDKIFNSIVKDVTTDVNGTKTIVTKLDGFSFAYCIITISGNNVLINVDIPELDEKYHSRNNPVTNMNYILQVDNNNSDNLEGGEPKKIISEKVPFERTINLEKNALTGNAKLGVTDPATINIMVVYTPAAKTWANTNEGSINNTIASAISKCNTASQNSNLGITYTLVHSAEVNYTEVTANNDLDALTTNGDGIIDEVHTLRNTYAADIVVFFTLENNTGGLGWLLDTRYGASENGFSISRVQQASWTYTTIHEIGHNMGAHHHKAQTTQPGPTTFPDWSENTWSAGWRWTGSDNGHYCDIMTYESGTYFADGITNTRIPYFSDPNVTHMGQPAGNSVDGNNALTLRETKHYVAQYKDANTLLYCEAGTNNWGYTSIFNVSIGTINQNSYYSTYSDFSFNTTDVTPGVNHPLTITKSSTSSYEAIVWVDWNNDKDFIDNGELVYQSGAQSAVTFSTNINPPVGTSAGEKRMRIRLHSTTTGPNTTPCGNADRGEVEDYTLNVTSPTTYDIQFNVTSGGSAVQGANVTIGTTSVTTNSSGVSVFTNMSNGTYNYNVTKTGYQSSSGTVTVSNGNAVKNVSLTPNTYTVQFTVTSSGAAMSGASVVFDLVNQTTNVNGQTTFTGKVNGTYNYTISKTGYQNATGTVTVLNGNAVKSVSLYEDNFDVTFNITDGTNPVQDAGVTFNGSTLQTNASGIAVFTNVPVGTGLPYTVSKTGFVNKTGTVNVTNQNVTVPVIFNTSITTTQLTSASCGISTTDRATTIYCDRVPGEEAYEFNFTNAVLGFNQTLSNPSDIKKFYIQLSSVPGILNGYTYDVKVRAKASGQWSDWGSVCQVTLSLGSTKLSSSSCGLTTSSKATVIYCDRVSGEEGYMFEFSNSSLGFLQTASNPADIKRYYIQLSNVAGIQYGYTYDVRVKAKVSGQWSDWGTICTVTLSVGTTQLGASSCGLSTGNMATMLYCNRVPGEEAYQFEFTNLSLGFNQVVSNPYDIKRYYLQFSNVPGIVRGYTYDVKVRAKVNGIWGSYGPVCQVTLNSLKSNEEFTENNINNTPEIVLYPNPAIDYLNIVFSNNTKGTYQMEISDITGRTILIEEGSIDSDNYYRQKDISNWKRGLYFIKVTVGSTTITKKFLKQ